MAAKLSDRDGWVALGAARRWLGVSWTTMRKWVAAKTIKVKKTPTGRLMIRRSDMEGLYR